MFKTFFSTGQSKDDAVGRPIMHRAALQASTGEAMLLDDIPVQWSKLFILIYKIIYLSAVFFIDIVRSNKLQSG